jgi:hypothetical protein
LPGLWYYLDDSQEVITGGSYELVICKKIFFLLLKVGFSYGGNCWDFA